MAQYADQVGPYSLHLPDTTQGGLHHPKQHQENAYKILNDLIARKNALFSQRSVYERHIQRYDQEIAWLTQELADIQHHLDWIKNQMPNAYQRAWVSKRRVVPNVKILIDVVLR